MREETAMAQQKAPAKPSRSKRDWRQKPGSSTGRKNQDDEVSSFEKELAGYLQQRIKPGLNSGAIPLLARSIAKDIAHREAPGTAAQNGDADDDAKAESDEQAKAGSDDEQPDAESEEQPDAKSGDEQSDDEKQPEAESEDDEAQAESGDDSDSDEEEEAPDFEADMHDLQAELGEHWILRFSVQGDDAWLTAEMDDGSQRIEAPTADVLAQAVELLNESGGRSG
jgi:hypothetical protein